jgi:hypothetical protein
MIHSAALWEQLFDAIIWKRGVKRLELAPLKKFNDLVNEWVPGIQHLSPESCHIFKRTLTREHLHALSRKHDKSEPYRIDGTIILFRHGNTDHVIDGNNRVNHWLAEDDQSDHAAIVVELKK